MLVVEQPFTMQSHFKGAYNVICRALLREFDVWHGDIDAAELGVALVVGLLDADPVGGLVLEGGVGDGSVGQAVEVLLPVALHAVVHDVVLGRQELSQLQICI